MRSLLLCAFLIAGCATTGGESETPEYFAATLAGAVYDNAVQADAAGADVVRVAFTARTPASLNLAWSDDPPSRAGAWVFSKEAGGVTLDILGPCRLKVIARGKGAWDAATEDCVQSTGERYDARVTVMPTGLLFSETRTDPSDDAQTDALPPPPLDLRRR